LLLVAALVVVAQDRFDQEVLVVLVVLELELACL
jgi:hypothetical protein